MKTAIRLTLFALMALNLNACGIGVESNDETKVQAERESKAISDNYSRIIGVYEGAISNELTGLKPYRARLTLWMVTIEDGKHSDGTPKMAPKLRGQFQLLDHISETDHLVLSGDFSNSNELKMSTVAASASGPGSSTGGGAGDIGGAGFYQLSLLGRIDADQASVSVNRAKGPWGNFSGRKVSNEPTAPAGGDNADYRERLLKNYRKIAGTYRGNVLTYVESQENPGEMVEASRYPVEIKLLIVESPSGGDGVAIPKLVATYIMIDNRGSGAGSRSLSVQFNSMDGDIAMKSSVSNPGVPGYEIFSITGKIDNRTLKGTQYDRFGTHVLEATRL